MCPWLRVLSKPLRLVSLIPLSRLQYPLHSLLDTLIFFLPSLPFAFIFPLALPPFLQTNNFNSPLFHRHYLVPVIRLLPLPLSPFFIPAAIFSSFIHSFIHFLPAAILYIFIFSSSSFSLFTTDAHYPVSPSSPIHFLHFSISPLPRSPPFTFNFVF